MGDRPIIFSASMVCALLAGRKNMTRRLRESPGRWEFVEPGTRLWVRESLTHITSDPVTARPCSVHCYTASIPPGRDSANPYEPNYLFPDDGEPPLKPKNISAIHMPRWASRLTLVVTATKIERLHKISQADVLAEGIPQASIDRYEEWFDKRDCPGLAFGELWNEIHGPGAWRANPEVVAITFRVERANIDANTNSGEAA